MYATETHDIEKVDNRIRLVAGGDKLDKMHNLCISPPNNVREPSRLQAKSRKFQFYGAKVCRCSTCSEVRHTRRTYHNPRANCDVNYKADGVKIEELQDGSYAIGTSRM